MIKVSFSLIGVFSLVVLPFHSDARGLALMGTGGKKAEKTIEIAHNSQTLPLLTASLGSELSGTGGLEITIVEDSALQAETSLLGSGTDAYEEPGSDEISTYVVREGDTIKAIADMFGVSSQTVSWANELKSGERLVAGQVLVILPVSGVRHTVAKGETLAGLAKKFKGDVKDIALYNGISENEILAVGTEIIIPGGVVSSAPKPSSKVAVRTGSASKTIDKIKSLGGNANGYYIRPTVGVRSQGLHDRYAVDIAAPTGTPIVASAAGTVTYVNNTREWGGGYGYYTIVSHDNGTQTLYAHMSKVATARGAKVRQGEVIGYVGNTGRSTGPHLHFEVRGAKNPGVDNSWAKLD